MQDWIENHGCLQRWFGDDLAISYIANPSNPFDLFLVSPENRGRPETALKVRAETKLLGWLHYILYGDWREQFEQAILTGGVEAALKVFRDNIEHMTDTSDRLETTQ